MKDVQPTDLEVLLSTARHYTSILAEIAKIPDDDWTCADEAARSRAVHALVHLESEYNRKYREGAE